MKTRRDLFLDRPPQTGDPKLDNYLRKLDQVLRILVRDVSDDLVDLENQVNPSDTVSTRTTR